MYRDRRGIHNPYDSLVAAIFGSVADAGAVPGALLRNATGERPVRGTVERLSERLVDGGLRSRWTDGTFRMRAEGDSPRPVFLVVEHKSRLDTRLRPQLLRYLAAVPEAFGDDFRPGLPVPRVVFPVLHQDGRPGEWLDWATGAEAGPATEIMGMRMDLVYRRLDGSGLGGLEDIPEADAGLRLLGLSGRESVPVGELAAVLDPLERGSVYMGQCLEYISCAVEIAEGERGLRELVRRYGGSEEERMMTTLTEKWKAEGLAEGLAKGQAEGLAEGQARSLLLQMGRRFGPVAEPVRKRVAGASSAELDAWLIRILDAGSVDEVLAASPRH